MDSYTLGFCKAKQGIHQEEAGGKTRGEINGKNYSEKIKKCLQKIDLITSLSSKKNIVHGEKIL